MGGQLEQSMILGLPGNRSLREIACDLTSFIPKTTLRSDPRVRTGCGKQAQRKVGKANSAPKPDVQPNHNGYPKGGITGFWIRIAETVQSAGHRRREKFLMGF